MRKMRRSSYRAKAILMKPEACGGEEVTLPCQRLQSATPQRQEARLSPGPKQHFHYCKNFGTVFDECANAMLLSISRKRRQNSVKCGGERSLSGAVCHCWK
ncbi:hypothetical protein STEG23_004530 [Scotinomys teguina]